MVMTRQAGHDARAAGGAHLGAILVEVHVADPVEPVLDAPVAADDSREPAGLAWVTVNDVTT
jgi:hypothetical protein